MGLHAIAGMSKRMSRLDGVSTAVGEANVQAPQMRLQARILDRDQVRWGARLVEVCVPQPGRCDECAARLPIDAGRIDDVAALVQPGAQQRVAARLGVENQVERDRLVAVWALLLVRR